MPSLIVSVLFLPYPYPYPYYSYLFPPRAFCKSFVSTESRYGTMAFFFLAGSLFSAKADITFPKAESDLLMLAPSFRRSPVAPVLSARSDPNERRVERERVRKRGVGWNIYVYAVADR